MLVLGWLLVDEGEQHPPSRNPAHRPASRQKSPSSRDALRAPLDPPTILSYPLRFFLTTSNQNAWTPTHSHSLSRATRPYLNILLRSYSWIFTSEYDIHGIYPTSTQYAILQRNGLSSSSHRSSHINTISPHHNQTPQNLNFNSPKPQKAFDFNFDFNPSS